jgi:hypothetical protein
MNTRNIDNNPYNLKQTVAAPAYLSLISYPRRVFRAERNILSTWILTASSPFPSTLAKSDI